LLLGGAIDVLPKSFRSSSIEISVGECFRFLIPFVAVSPDEEMFVCKSKYSPKHVSPADKPSFNASDFLS
jgi:hypothetical protein